MTGVSLMVTDNFDDAQLVARHQGKLVGGTLTHDGTPVYFVVEPELDDQETHDLAFEIREGRRPSTYERWALEAAKRRREAQLV